MTLFWAAASCKLRGLPLRLLGSHEPAPARGSQDAKTNFPTSFQTPLHSGWEQPPGLHLLGCEWVTSSWPMRHQEPWPEGALPVRFLHTRDFPGCCFIYASDHESTWPLVRLRVHHPAAGGCNPSLDFLFCEIRSPIEPHWLLTVDESIPT